jgi:hypothetical protein
MVIPFPHLFLRKILPWKSKETEEAYTGSYSLFQLRRWFWPLQRIGPGLRLSCLL